MFYIWYPSTFKYIDVLGIEINNLQNLRLGTYDSRNHPYA